VVVVRVAVYGNGGHGRDIAATLPDFAGFMDDDPERAELAAVPGEYEVIIGVNDGRTRRELEHDLNAAGIRFHDLGRWVHPDASVGPAVHLGAHTHVNAGAFLTRCIIGDFCTIGPNATICGDVIIGQDVVIGAGAVICDRVEICSGVTIAANATVPPKTVISKPGTYIGSPARMKPSYYVNGRAVA
jgi:UDP-3-O-[3-hydroxymyristoyl] glucosamine N-acyltransferase